MTIDDIDTVPFDHHSPAYREAFPGHAQQLREGCPVSWSEEHGGYWVVTGHEALRTLSKRTDLLSNDKDQTGERPAYVGVSIPPRGIQRGGFLEMDPPDQSEYRRILNPFLSPAAVRKWEPMIADLTRACIDEHIESGRIDFVDDYANVVPAVLTLAMLGIPLADWEIYCEPAHMQVYTPPNSPEFPRMIEGVMNMRSQLAAYVDIRKEHPRPGMITSLLNATVNGEPLPDEEVAGVAILLIGGGFDTTTSLLAASFDWLGDNPADRGRLVTDDGFLDLATEEFLRYFTPASGNGRTVTRDVEIEGHAFAEEDRIFLAYALCNHDPEAFPNPDQVELDRFPNPHAAFGLGIHRCIGSNVARLDFKLMLREVLRRMPDYQIEPEGRMRYETIGTINGFRHLPATFTPGHCEGPSFAEVLDTWQARLDAEPAPELTQGT